MTHGLWEDTVSCLARAAIAGRPQFLAVALYRQGVSEVARAAGPDDQTPVLGIAYLPHLPSDVPVRAGIPLGEPSMGCTDESFAQRYKRNSLL